MKFPFIHSLLANTPRIFLKRVPVVLIFAVFLSIMCRDVRAEVLMVDLGSASGFAVLAGSGVTNGGLSVITGDVGSSPTITTAGFGTVTLYGTNHGGDVVTEAAKGDLELAYSDAVGRTATTLYGAIFDLGGLTLTSGVYKDPSSFSITGTLTLDAQGDPDAVWIFQAGSTLTTTANSSVLLINGAKASNVFWQVGSSATLGADTEFAGNILAWTSITANSGIKVEGSLLAINGAVALVEVTIIPEPQTILLVGFGLIALLALKRFYPQAKPVKVKAKD